MGVSFLPLSSFLEMRELKLLNDGSANHAWSNVLNPTGREPPCGGGDDFRGWAFAGGRPILC